MSLIRCPECGKEISTSASICPNCGYNKLKKVNKHLVLDSVCILFLLISTVLCANGIWVGWLCTIVFGVIYGVLYDRNKKDATVDTKDIKNSLITIFVFFIIQSLMIIK